jgi:hypothetical protein
MPSPSPKPRATRHHHLRSRRRREIPRRSGPTPRTGICFPSAPGPTGQRAQHRATPGGVSTDGPGAESVAVLTGDSCRWIDIFLVFVRIHGPTQACRQRWVFFSGSFIFNKWATIYGFYMMWQIIYEERGEIFYLDKIGYTPFKKMKSYEISIGVNKFYFIS